VVVEGRRDPFARACAVAAERMEDGVLFWSERFDRLDCAILLEPDEPAGKTLEAFYVLGVAMADTLSALLPPLLPLCLAWPGRVRLNGADVGVLRCALAESRDAAAPPGWLVLGVQLEITAPRDEPGHDPDRTSLHDEGAVDVGAQRLLESLSRHLVAWLHRWQDEGFGPVRASWNSRCESRGAHATVHLAGQVYHGLIEGLDAGGAFRIGGKRLFLGEHLHALA
jgi:biotin-(acetyl-CoA carboxylase) ligase